MNSHQRVRKEHKIATSIRHHIRVRANNLDVTIEQGPQPLSYWVLYRQIATLLAYSTKTGSTNTARIFTPNYRTNISTICTSKYGIERVDQCLTRIKDIINNNYDKNLEAYTIIDGILEQQNIKHRHFCTSNKQLLSIFDDKIVIYELAHYPIGESHMRLFNLHNPQLHQQITDHLSTKAKF